MSDDLDLRGIDDRHEPDPQFRAALKRRVAAIVAGVDPGSVTVAHDLVPVDLETTSAKPAPKRNRRRVARVILAAAAVVAAIALVVSRDGDDSSPADRPSPTVTVPPQALPNDFGPLLPGTYYVDEVSGTPTPRIFATLGTGWWDTCEQCGGWGLGKRAAADTDFDEMTLDELQQHEIGGMGFSQPAAVFLDACHTNDHSYHPGPVTTLDGLVAALSEQKGWADVTAPSDISIDGYAGKAFQRTAPADMSDCDTMPSYSPRVKRGSAPYPIFVSWLSEPDLELDRFSGSGSYEPGEIETLWIIDIDGTVVVISTRVLPEPSAGADADFAADVLDSIRIDRRFDTTGAEVTTPMALVRGSQTSGADVELFRVTTDEPTYWRLATLPEFDGRTWGLPDSELSPIDDTADSQPDGRTVRRQLQILALQGPLLPAAADPMQVEPNTDVRFNADTSTLVTLSELASGDRFTIVSEAPEVTLDGLRAATTDNPPDDLSVEVPDNLPDRVSDLAAEVTAGANTDYDRLIALQNWFRTFDYSTDVESGHGSNEIENFLQTRIGYSEQFAAAFAVMARTLGIPSRVAVGFTAGEPNAYGSYSVTGKNAHAWPEVWFDDIGWVSFEPTPQPTP